ncbi:unnamed protein product [Prorocentrum cordatum]|uniref:Uncharacterized protein n=1 Tax=Prorocentrum cordatum TaxID=2364126 RepID=A0ABN9SEB6_9DINO|nr:unnamed protein product [Polarella glacialis]
MPSPGPRGSLQHPLGHERLAELAEGLPDGLTPLAARLVDRDDDAPASPAAFHLRWAFSSQPAAPRSATPGADQPAAALPAASPAPGDPQLAPSKKLRNRSTGSLRPPSSHSPAAASPPPSRCPSYLALLAGSLRAS